MRGRRDSVLPSFRRRNSVVPSPTSPAGGVLRREVFLGDYLSRGFAYRRDVPIAGWILLQSARVAPSYSKCI